MGSASARREEPEQATILGAFPPPRNRRQSFPPGVVVPEAPEARDARAFFLIDLKSVT